MGIGVIINFIIGMHFYYVQIVYYKINAANVKR